MTRPQKHPKTLLNTHKEKKLIAEVIINSNVKNLNKTFDYLVPIDLENKISIGSRVLVQFGNKKALEEAFVVGFKDKSEFEAKLKEISKVEDKLYLNKEDVELAKWMAHRYFCNVSDCIKLMSPPGTLGKQIQNRVKEKTGKFVYLKKEILEIESEIEEGKIKNPKQIRILRFLEENDGTHISDLNLLTDTTISSIKTLEKNGYIEIVEQVIERNPFQNKEIKRDKKLLLTEEQQNAFQQISEKIQENAFDEFLLYGVTGSR